MSKCFVVVFVVVALASGLVLVTPWDLYWQRTVAEGDCRGD